MQKDLQKFVDFTKKWEGGLSRDTHDKASSYPSPMLHNGKMGWHTNMGITYKTWESVFGVTAVAQQDFFNMTNDQWFRVFKTLYWDGVKADYYDSFSVAVYVAGMAWGSGGRRAIKLLQQAVKNLGIGIVVDGAVGPKTIAKTNQCNPVSLFDELLAVRAKYFKSIAPEGSNNARFLKGWMRRLEDYRKTFRPENG